MINIFKSKRVRELEETVDSLKRRIVRLEEKETLRNNDLNRLERTIEQAKDEPTYVLKRNYDRGWNYGCNSPRWDLYLYINKHEYIIPVDELCATDGYVEYDKLRVKDNIAIITFKHSEDKWANNFTIDYITGKYVHNYVKV